MSRRLFYTIVQPGREIPVAGTYTLRDILMPAGIFYALLGLRSDSFEKQYLENES